MSSNHVSGGEIIYQVQFFLFSGMNMSNNCVSETKILTSNFLILDVNSILASDTIKGDYFNFVAFKFTSSSCNIKEATDTNAQRKDATI